MKGVVFTLEALITFSFFSIVLLGALLLVQPSQQEIPLSETVMLNDFYQILELQYHEEVAEFMITKGNSLSPNLERYFLFLEEKTGRRMFLEYGKRSIECEPFIQSSRLFVFPSFSYFSEIGLVEISYFHELKIGMCK